MSINDVASTYVVTELDSWGRPMETGKLFLVVDVESPCAEDVFNILKQQEKKDIEAKKYLEESLPNTFSEMVLKVKIRKQAEALAEILKNTYGLTANFSGGKSYRIVKEIENLFIPLLETIAQQKAITNKNKKNG